MTEHLFVGVDLGTQSVKVRVVDYRGTTLSHAARPLTSNRSETRHEQDPHQWISATRNALAQAMQALHEIQRECIASIAFCGTSGTITLIDHNGTPVSAALMYDDARAAQLAPMIQQADPDRWQRLGYHVQPTWAITKIVDMARRQELRGAYIAHQPDVLASALTGTRVATDWSSALKSGFDLIDLRWADDTYTKLGVRPEHLPRVVAPGTVLGHSTRDWETSTGLPRGVAVVAGMTDGCASQLGAGAVREGDWHSEIGTTLVLKGVSNSLIVDDAGAVYSHRSPTPGQWFPGGASSTGARAIGALFPGVDLAELEREATRLWRSHPEAVTPVYPLIGRGERFPFVQPSATGFAKINGHLTDVRDLGDGPKAYLSVLIGVACVERLCFEALAGLGAPVSGRLTTSGGGAQNTLWSQLRAYMLDMPVAVPASGDPSMGMAMLAASPVENASIAQLADRMVSTHEVFEPRTEDTVVLDEVYGGFRAALQNRGWII